MPWRFLDAGQLSPADRLSLPASKNQHNIGSALTELSHQQPTFCAFTSARPDQVRKLFASDAERKGLEKEGA